MFEIKTIPVLKLPLISITLRILIVLVMFFDAETAPIITYCMICLAWFGRFCSNGVGPLYCGRLQFHIIAPRIQFPRTHAPLHNHFTSAVDTRMNGSLMLGFSDCAHKICNRRAQWNIHKYLKRGPAREMLCKLQEARIDAPKLVLNRAFKTSLVYLAFFLFFFFPLQSPIFGGLAGQLAGWLVGWLVGWMASCLAGGSLAAW